MIKTQEVPQKSTRYGVKIQWNKDFTTTIFNCLSAMLFIKNDAVLKHFKEFNFLHLSDYKKYDQDLHFKTFLSIPMF